MENNPAQTGGIWSDQNVKQDLHYDPQTTTTIPAKPLGPPTIAPQTVEKRVAEGLSSASSVHSEAVPSLDEIVNGVVKKLTRDLGYPGNSFKTAMATYTATTEERVKEWMDKQLDAKSNGEPTVQVVEELRNQVEILTKTVDEMRRENATRSETENKIFEQALKIINDHPDLLAEVEDKAHPGHLLEDMRTLAAKTRSPAQSVTRGTTGKIRRPGRIL